MVETRRPGDDELVDRAFRALADDVSGRVPAPGARAAVRSARRRSVGRAAVAGLAFTAVAVGAGTLAIGQWDGQSGKAGPAGNGLSTAAPSQPPSSAPPAPIVTDLSPGQLLAPEQFPAGWAQAWRETYTGPLGDRAEPFPCARTGMLDPDPADVLVREVFLDLPGQTGGYDGPSGGQLLVASRSTAAAERAVAAARTQLMDCRTAGIPGDTASRIVRELPGLYDGGFVARVSLIFGDGNAEDFDVAVGRVGNLVTVIAVNNYARPVAEPADLPSPDNAVQSLRAALERLGGG